MFNIIARRHRHLVNLFQHHVGKSQINKGSNNTAPRAISFLRCCDKQACIQYVMKSGYVINENRRYTSLPQVVEYEIPHSLAIHGKENLFAHSVLESKEIYWKTLAHGLPVCTREIHEDEVNSYLNKVWKNVPIPEIVEAFKIVSHYAARNGECLLDPKYEKFLKYLIANVPKFTDSEINDIIRSLCMWPLKHTRHDKSFKSLYTALDAECLKRAATASWEDLLLVFDHWYMLGLPKYSDFCSFVITKMGRRPKHLTTANLIQFMFCINVSRTRPSNLYNIEYRLEQIIDDLDLDEIAIISMGFFKSQTPFRNPMLLSKIIQRTILNIDTIHEISLASLMKIIRYSHQLPDDANIIWELLVSTLPRIPTLSIKALVHILALMVRTRLFHEELINIITLRFHKNIEHARLKDLERLVMALTTFNFTPNIQPNIFETVVQELRSVERAQSLTEFPRSLANCLHYLSIANVYPKDLIAMVLDPQKIHTTYGPNAWPVIHPILAIDLNVEVEVPDYTGPRLTAKQRAIIAKKNALPIPKSQDSNNAANSKINFISSIMDTLKDVLDGCDLIHTEILLPHHRLFDIVICLDKNKTPIPVKSILPEMELGEIKRVPSNLPEGTQLLAVIPCGVNCYIRDTRLLLGKDAMRIRQLRQIGYTPIVIPWYEWQGNKEYKIQYLKDKIFG
ncbi:uncharacterized protein LOC105691028 [Athalia rosae]|uniref:uncharacterized protein LOC105691028 n=1 Tax=Athalia rosae TaxID=37344 RepID=UPI002033992F|nr:uncharacterized protein LOC105691028 [Athalia rosae]XP_048512181.1 uncharacterized protein LOC105691028 [Athalia rosae]